MGIIAKIWNIKDGSKGRGAGVQIMDSISYITDEKKCDEHLSSEGQIGRELKYVTNDVKTLEGLYTGCRNILDIRTAAEEMMRVKEFHKKTGGRVALHGIVSLDEAESDKRNAGKLMMLISDLLEELFPDNQAVYAVHTNTENLHVHFIVNTVGMNGKKIHMDKSFMGKVFEPALNRLAVRYGFTPNENWQMEKKDVMPFGERMFRLRQAVDEAIERSEDFDELLKDLRDQGLKVNCGKYMSLKAEGMTRPVRSGRLGSLYTLEKIKERLLHKRDELLGSEVTGIYEKRQDPADVYIKTSPLKKYKDMNDDEKKEARKALEEGRNPWMERKTSNWMLEKMADEFRRTADVYGLIKRYAPDSGSAFDALENIVKLQKKTAEEKKAVRENLKSYQPVIRICREIKKHARKAYLYEVTGDEEYKPFFEEYKALAERLEKGYGKTVMEVADFLEDQEGQILYAKAQSKALSDDYKTILRFKSGSLNEEMQESLYDAVGFSKAREKAALGVFETGINYIAADGSDAAFIRAVLTPDTVNGKNTETAQITVFDASGDTLEEFSSKDMTVREFNRRLSDVKGRYGLYKCRSFDKKEDAVSFVKIQSEVKKAKRKASD